ncbi:hypothetical protein [Isoptericola sp. NPDC019482]|uniref:hypothetical protein n=1 Tax=Isoptericola sp. NPDC019482 TaxID=3154688 RepID=UPI00346E1C67
MTGWTRALLGAALLVAVSAGCSGEGSAGADVASSEAPESAPATETVAETTVDQWASIVAGQRHAVDEMNADWEDATCSATAIAMGDAPDCEAYLIAMGYTAETAAVAIGGAINPDSDTYLGDPPAEIADLYESTFEAADAASVAVSDWENEAATPMDATRAWDDLLTKFAEWEPYL